MSKLKKLREDRAAIFKKIDALRKTTDGREMSAEEKRNWEQLLKDYDCSDRAISKEEKFEDIQRRQAEQKIRAEKSDRNVKRGPDTEYRSAFFQYLINGENGVSPEMRTLFEKRAGITGVSGGVLVPKNLAQQIEIALKNYGGMFEAGTIISTSSGADLIMPTVNDTHNKAVIVAEYQKSTKAAPSFGSETLKAYTYRTPIVPVSVELLQDSDFDMESLLSGLLADSFGRGVNEDLTIGDGTGKPKGIVNAAIDCGTNPTATGIKLDDIIDLIKSVDHNYAKNGRFMFNRETLYSLVKIKDTTGRFIWQEGAKDGTPPTLFGKTYIVNDDVPNIGAGNASVLFGDFGKYKIRLVKDFRVIRLNELLAEYLSIGIFGFARMDGVLLDAGTHPIKNSFTQVLKIWNSPR